MLGRLLHTRVRLVAMFVLAAVPFSPPRVCAQAGGKQTPGVEFDMKATIAVSGAMSGMVAGMPPGYSAHGVAVGARLRIDIVDGGLAMLADKGDYILFDTAGMTVVHPGKKEFVVVPRELPSKMVEQIQALGMTVTVGEIALSLDSLPGTDTVAGFPTRHYKTSVDYTVTLEGMGASQAMKTKATSEYWMASVPGLASNPLEQTNQVSGSAQGITAMSSSGPFKELSARSDSLTRHLAGTAVRTRATTNTDIGAAGNLGLDMSAEMSNVKHGPVAASLFAVPADYTRGALPFPGGI